ncbi:MAG: guanylate kinase [Deltaproteobacteria bacterium]|nr:MAG: guanylate kinase [Deltaproteobacteria bacterium]
MSKGLLFIISAPSGAGKSTLIERVRESVGGLGFSISHTTRAPRAGEVDGVHYHFVGVEEFREMAARGEFAEWALVHSNLYGTSHASLDAVRRDGKDVILDIDVVGALNLKEQKIPGSVFIFIEPPSLKELEKRLRLRNKDDEEIILKRLLNARQELEKAPLYDYIVVNDDLEEASKKLTSIIENERLRANGSEEIESE